MAALEQSSLNSIPKPLTNKEKAFVFNQSLNGALLYVAVGVGLLYALLSTSHYLLLPPDYKWKLLAFSISNLVLVTGMSLYALKRTLPIPLSHVLASVLILMLIANSAAHLGYSGEIKQSTNLALLVVGVGCFFLSYAWWILMTACCILTWAAVVNYAPISDPDWVHYCFMYVICLVLSFLVLIARRKGVLKAEMAQRRDALRVNALETALENIKTLEGFIPICAWCKKVRDDEGFWRDVETYVSTRTDATFSHGLCPGCKDEHFEGV